MNDQSSPGLEILGVAVPDVLLDVANGHKALRGESWALTTKEGVLLGIFASESELDNWWLAFQESQGRLARPCANTPVPSARKNKRKRSKASGKGSVPTLPTAYRGSNLKDWDLD